MDTAFLSLDKRSILMRDRDAEVKPVFTNWQSRLIKQVRSGGISLEVHQANEVDLCDVSPVNLTCVIGLAETNEGEWRLGGDWTAGVLSRDQVVVIPTGMNFSVRSPRSTTMLIASLDDSLFRRVLGEHAPGSKDLFLVPRVVEDVFLCESLKNLARHDDVNDRMFQMHAQSLAVSLATHLVNRYAERTAGNVPRRDRKLSLKIMELIDAHVNTHLSGEIKVIDLARIAGLSPFHFSRVFKSTTGKSPYRYVMNRRLTRGIELLRSSEMPVAEIAVAVGFCDQSHFTRELSRTRGVTPRQVRTG